MDATKESALASRYGVSGYPTLKFFPAGDSKDPVDYNSGRDADSFLSFLNEKAGTSRTADGGLAASFGRLPDFDTLATSFLSTEDKDTILSRAQDAAPSLTGQAEDQASHYVKTMNKIIKKGSAYVAKEIKRLQGLIEGDSVSAARKDLFRLRQNILRAFQ